MAGSIIALFLFTIRQTLLNRKIIVTLLLFAAPIGLILLIRNVAPAPRNADELWMAYHSVVQFLLMMVVLPMVCMVHGISMIGAEVDSRTIGYLITRRMHRATVLVVKYLAVAVVLIVLGNLSMIALHLCTLVGWDMETLLATSRVAVGWDPPSDLLCYLRAITFGTAGFLAVFTLIGLLTSKPMTYSVLYFILVELTLSNLPMKARICSLLHLMREEMASKTPHIADLYDISPDLAQAIYPPDSNGIPLMLVVILAAVILAGVLMTVRELMPTKVTRE